MTDSPEFLSAAPVLLTRDLSRTASPSPAATQPHRQRQPPPRGRRALAFPHAWQHTRRRSRATRSRGGHESCRAAGTPLRNPFLDIRTQTSTSNADHWPCWVVSTLPEIVSNRDLLRGLRDLHFTGEVAIVARDGFGGAALTRMGAPTIV